MKKKLVVSALVLALAVTLIGGATLAYFTDNDEQDNVFTFGNVDIDLLESSLHRDNDAATDEQIINDDANTYADYLATNGKDMVPGRWVKKAPYVYNKGQNAAYVRIRMEIPANLFDHDIITVMEYTTAKNNGALTGPVAYDTGNPETKGYTWTYTEALEPGAVTYYAPFWQFKVTDNIDNEDLVAAGITDLNADQVITVYADAIQAEGFADAAAAFAAFDAQEN